MKKTVAIIFFLIMLFTSTSSFAAETYCSHPYQVLEEFITIQAYLPYNPYEHSALHTWWYVCRDCGEPLHRQSYQYIPEPHVWKNGICTLCGEENRGK